MKSLQKMGLVFCAFLSVNSICFAGSAEMAAMQKQLNAEVMSKPFSVEEESKIDAYIAAATKKGEKPAAYTGTHWQPGYTCANLRSYSYNEYRDCRYYHNYYGSYYPY